MENHIEDIWLLVCSIKNKSFVPRILQKNGKRSKEEFEQSQLSSSQTSIRAPCSSPSHQPLTCSSQVNLCRLNYTLSPTVVKTSASANVTSDLLNSDFTSESNQCSNSNPTSTNISSSNEFTSSNDLVFRSSVISDINLLKTAVSNLHRELHQLRIDGRKLVPQQSIESCLLYVRLNVNDVSSIGTPLLESVLSCDVQRYWLIGNWQRPTLKVKIIEPNLLKALTSGNKNGHYTSVWHKKVTPSIPKSSSPQRPHPVSHHPSHILIHQHVNILSWNCRGLTSSIPYIQSLLEMPSVLVLSEHWLWPYELSRLNDISDDYDSTSKADSRLSDISHERRGCGGIAILWHKTIGASPVSDITSDRVCAIRFCDPNDNKSTFSVIGVYLPCSDQGMDCYRDHLQELECVISDSILLGPVIILGDFNAHRGSLGGVRGTGDSNLQGILLSDVMNRHNLCAVSQCEWASGPLHTYVSGNSMTTVDYIIASPDAISTISSCKTLPMNDLNMSDHLPLIAELSIERPAQTQRNLRVNQHLQLDWEHATKSGEINEYRRLVRLLLSDVNPHACLNGKEDIDAAISHLSGSLKDAASNSISIRNLGNGTMRFFHPSVLKAELLGNTGKRMDVQSKVNFMKKRAD